MHIRSRTVLTSNSKSYFGLFVLDEVQTVIFPLRSGHDTREGLWLPLHAAVFGLFVHPWARVAFYVLGWEWEQSQRSWESAACGCVSETEIGAEFQKGVVACAGDHPHVRKMRSKKWAGRTVSSSNYW